MGRPVTMHRPRLTVTAIGKGTSTAAATVTGLATGAPIIIDRNQHLLEPKAGAGKRDSFMKRIPILLMATASLLAATARAHDAPNLEHTHAFQETAYGSYRQGHQVSGPQGDIIIWSPREYTGYQQAPAVRFARPRPITEAPGSRPLKSRAGHWPAAGYGKKERRDSGD